MRIINIICCLIFSLPICAEKELIPRTILFGNQTYSNPSISPDGTKLAYVAPCNNTPNVWIKTVDKNDDAPLTFDYNRGITSYRWTHDNQHIIYAKDDNGKENWRLYKINIKTKKSIPLTPPDRRCHILEYSKEKPHQMLILVSGNKGFDVQLIDLHTTKTKTILTNPGEIQDFFADKKLQIRGILKTLPDGGKELLIRKDNTSEWQQLTKWDLDDSLTSFPCAFHRNGTSVTFMDSRNRDKSCLARLNLETGEYERLLEDADYDIGIPWINPRPLFHPDTDEIIAMPVIKDQKQWILLDKTYAEDFAALKMIAQGEASIVSTSSDFSKWVISYVSDTQPMRFYLYDRNSQTAIFLFSSQPELEKYHLQKTKPISFQSRDGLTIHGYITYPDTPNCRNLPLLIDVHGGPWERNMWGFCPEAQFFANRGYVYLQVNFRGSTSYGKEFLNAGNKEWGRNMHYDIVDAAKWAIQQEIADPEKIAIAGFSYGGYEALCGAAFNSDLFACAISLSGISNLKTLILNWPRYATAAHIIFRKRIGDPSTEEKLLNKRSPLSFAHQIKIPLLIGQGENDVRVTPLEAEQIGEALRKRGINYEYLLFANEGHGLSKAENRVRWVIAFEKFLAKHLGGRCESNNLEKTYEK